MTPYMDGRGAVHFPERESDEPPRMGDLGNHPPVDSRDLEQERDLRELETAERRKIAKAAIQQMLDTFDEWYK